ncbi:MAG TPA: ribosome maturation factor RimM [Polyangiaceae bacterium]
MIKPDAWVPLASIARAHGVRGEVRLNLYNRDSDMLMDADEVLLRHPNGEEEEVSIDGARRANDAILMRLHGVADKDKADALRGAQLCLKRADFPALEDGEFYVCDAVGAAVTLNGAPLGKVKDIVFYPTVSVLVVDGEDGKPPWEVPLTDAYVGTVDLENAKVDLISIDDLERK